MKHIPLLILLFYLLHFSALTQESAKPAAVNPAPDTLVAVTSGKYLNIPVSTTADRAFMHFEIDGKKEPGFMIRLAPSSPDYWVYKDISPYNGKTLKIIHAGKSGGLEKIFQADTIVGQGILYKEKDRPQVHYTPKRGSLGDANGLIYLDGEYHMFYQHFPYDRDGSRYAHWGHAVSRDLLRWTELPIALLRIVWEPSTPAVR